MRGNDEQQTAVFSYVSAEQRIAPIILCGEYGR